MANKVRRSWAPIAMISLFLGSLAGCHKRDMSYLKNPYLSPEQKVLLTKLQAQSKKDMHVSVWPAAGSVNRLALDAPSGASPDTSPNDAALDFLRTAQALWHLSSVDQLQVGPAVVGNGCTTVTFQQKYPTGQEVYNANLAIGIGPRSDVRMASGTVAGNPFPITTPENRITADQASGILLKTLGEPKLVLPKPREIVLDPFFLSNARHSATNGWLFEAAKPASTEQSLGAGSKASPISNFTRENAQAAIPNQLTESAADSFAGPFIVNEQTGVVTVRGPSSQPVVVGTGGNGCPGGSNGTLPEVIVDKMTGSPLYVGLRGVPIAAWATSDVNRAYNLLTSHLILPMYGDTNPWEILLNPQVTLRSDGGTSVRFSQFAEGYPVEGTSLTVNFDAAKLPLSILGRVIYRPMFVSSVNLNNSVIVKEAFAKYLDLECGSDYTCRQTLQPDGSHYFAPSVVVLSSRIFANTTLPPGQEHLAWKIVFPRRVIYWSANDDNSKYLFSYPTILTHIPLVILDSSRANGVEFSNVAATPVTVTPMDADGTSISGFMPTINSFYSSVGRVHSFDNNDATTLCVATNDAFEKGNAAFAPPTPPGSVAVCAGFGGRILVGTGMGVNDVIAHEFTHAVTSVTAALINSGESGALNESYSDVMGKLAFPDQFPPTPANTWLMGIKAPGGPIRDMKNPLRLGQPDNVAEEQTMCSDQSTFTHQCDSIPNLAAVLSSDGGISGNSAPGIGQTKLKFLWYSTLTGGNPPASPGLTELGPADQFMGQRATIVENCWSLVATGTLSDGVTTFSPDDCFHVGDSFDTVGLSVTPQYGYSQFNQNLFGMRGNFTAFAGQHLFNGCTIKDITLEAVDAQNGSVMTSDIAQGLSVNFGNWGANVTSRGSPADPTDRSVKFHVWSNWWESGAVMIHESYNMPANITSNEQCENPAPPAQTTHLRTMYSTTLVGHWATFFNGGRNDDTVNGGVNMASGCTMQSVLGIHYVSNQAVNPPSSTADDGSRGFTITSTASSPTGLDTDVHTWHDGVSGIFVRVVYNVWETQGTDCSVPGSTQDSD